MQLEDWLDDLCVRFIVNLPPEELESVERICFQVEEAQWFYEDFIRPLDPSLPSLPLRAFSLRIFQHCPLFSQWSAEHYTTAFAEFMAYKSRVPVRGAIMLNDNMDECVLVKGWKKGANWSFPRGKINKDENDLDCAVREVYEETGFDLHAAGLVHDEKDMKYIEQTMREQHMKLYVFRGVPKSTHFEPRTRKEISKIEWYKLTDLPTLKKHKHQDSSGGEHAAMNANKFYMVAPFLGQLKKWIAQQKKGKENRYSSNLAAPPILAEESEADNVPMLAQAQAQADQQAQIPSDLPEVTISRSAEATAQLKQLFSIGYDQSPPPQQQQIPPRHMPQFDAAKSNALLSLLRNGPSVELRAGPHTPLEQASFPPEMPHSPHNSHVQPPPPFQQQPSEFHFQSELPTSPAPARNLREPIWQPASQQLPLREQFPLQDTNRGPGIEITGPAVLAPHAPYRQTGDPDFARTRQPSHALPTVPPASALPLLTSHTRSLLDVFKGISPPLPVATPQQAPPAKQSLLDLFKQVPSANDTVRNPMGASELNQVVQEAPISPPSTQGLEKATLPTMAINPEQTKNLHQNSLLKLFGLPAPKSSALRAEENGEPAAELAATSDHQHRAREGKQGDDLLALLRQQKKVKAASKPPAAVVKEGETAATLSGPLNQPNFESVVRSHKENANGMGRSPLTTHRTLFDPNQPVPVKILARPETPKQAQGKSPRPTKAKIATSSPKRSGKTTAKEQTKPFQPQILRRPQTMEGQTSTVPVVQAVAPSVEAVVPTSISREVSSEKEKGKGKGKEKELAERRPAQTDAHQQTLLSLFSENSSPASKGTQTPSRVVSPLSMSQLVSPKDEAPLSAIEPISTRSRIGSTASVGSGNASIRPGLEKRQTAAENKAFLLGYLGRMATQEG